MKDFSYMSFSSDVIAAATSALHAAVNSLPEPPSAAYVNCLAGIIRRAAKAGERNITVLRTIALLELQSSAQS